MSKSLYKELREIWGRQDVNANNPCPEALKLPVETYCYGFQLIQPCDDKVKNTKLLMSSMETIKKTAKKLFFLSKRLERLRPFVNMMMEKLSQ